MLNYTRSVHYNNLVVGNRASVEFIEKVKNNQLKIVKRKNHIGPSNHGEISEKESGFKNKCDKINEGEPYRPSNQCDQTSEGEPYKPNKINPLKINKLCKTSFLGPDAGPIQQGSL
jgi:hypothetical protein